jgi:hypothetical protein
MIMKRVLYITACLIGLIASLLLLAVCLNSNNPRISDLSSCIGLTGKNLLLNADFKDGLQKWSRDKAVSILTTNNVNYACIEGNPKDQVRIWQTIPVTSGQTYRLTFNLTGPDKGAFAIYRNAKSGKEQYVWCNGKNNHKYYSLIFVPKRTGKDQVYLSTNGIGQFYYSDTKLVEIHKNIKTVYIVLAILIAIITVVLLAKIDIIFFIMIFVLAIIPIAKMTKDKKSESENRTLAEYKPLFSKDKKINKNYGSDFNNWLNDHFWIRNDLMRNQNSLKYLIDGKVDNKFVSQGKDKWLFLKGNIRRMAKPESYYEGIYEDTKNAVKRFNDFCAKSNAKLYIVLAPFGEEVYSDELLNINVSSRIGRFEKYAARLQKDTGVPILYALKNLQNAKTNGLVQYKTDHHWTHLGAYSVYKELEVQIYQDFGLTQTVLHSFQLQKRQRKFGWGETFTRVKNIAPLFAKNIFPEDSVYMDFDWGKNSPVNDNGARLSNKLAPDKKVFLFGDSYVRNIFPFFGFGFRNTKYIAKPLQIYMPSFEKEIMIYKPDIVVMIIYSQNYNLIKNWYNK